MEDFKSVSETFPPKNSNSSSLSLRKILFNSRSYLSFPTSIDLFKISFMSLI